MAKINLKFYDGNDIYNDGGVEEELLAHYKKGDSIDINKNDIFYLTTSIRENILNWYPFKSDGRVLEIGCGCGTLTGMLCDKVDTVVAVEGSKRRATITYERHKNKNNLTIYAGNFKNIKLESNFDYIVLIGVFEYSKRFFDYENPYIYFLNEIKKLLKPDGKVLIAIENRYGIKYWAGSKEDHVCIPYAGFASYEYYDVQTFGIDEFKNMIKSVGFSKSKFYYPFPDYKLPTVIYTDEYTPRVDEIKTLPIYTYGDYVNFDINRTLEGIIDNNKFGFFSNSYLAEFGFDESELSKVVYARNQSYRNDDYKTITIIEDNNQITKKPCNKKAVKHLDQLIKNHKLIKKNGIKICEVVKKNNNYIIEKVEGKTVAEYIDFLLKENKKELAEKEFDLFVDYLKSISSFTKLKNPIIDNIKKIYTRDEYVLKISLLDSNISNIIRKSNGEYVMIDQEWYDRKQIPLDYIIYCSIAYLFDSLYSINNHFDIDYFFDKYNIDNDKILLFTEISEYYFSIYKNVIDHSAKQKLDNCGIIRFADSIDTFSVIYLDMGNGFTEEHKVVKFYKNHNNLFIVDFDIPEGTKNVRFDPCGCGEMFVYYQDFKVNGKNIEYDEFNVQNYNGKKIFTSKNPYFVLKEINKKMKFTITLKKMTPEEILLYTKTKKD